MTTSEEYADLGVFAALRVDGSEEAIQRLAELAHDDGWEQPWLESPPFAPHSRINDATLGTAGNLLGAVWARRQDVAGAERLAHWTADLLLSEAEPTEAGTNWPFIPRRFTDDVPPERRDRQMPNWSHGLAGIAASLAVAGSELGRPDLVEAARSGAQHLVTLGDTVNGGFAVPHVIPNQDDIDVYTFTWCHGPTGTSLFFTAAAAAPPGSATCSSTPGNGAAWTTTSPSRRSSATRWSSERTSKASVRPGASPSTATRTRCSRPASAGCRAPPASRRTSSGSPASSARGVRRPLSRGSTPGGTRRVAAVRILNIDVDEQRLEQWAGWFSPAEQPFLVDDELAAVVGGTERELSDEVRDTFCLYGTEPGLRHVWLDEEEFGALPRLTRAALVRAQRTHEREVVPSVRAWEPVVGERVRRQADGHRFVWWPSLLSGVEAQVLTDYVEEGRRPSRHDDVSEQTWSALADLLPGARRLAGTFPTASGPNCFGAVMAAAGVEGADIVWMLRKPFEDWLAAATRPAGVDDVPGTVLVWRSADGLVQHAAVTLGSGWALHKPSQGWMSPTKVLTVAECKTSSRAVGRRLERHTIIQGVG